jgi:cytochrome c oxidase cbb3-type subunit 1
VYGFFSMMMFGAMYYIIPRLTGWEWPSASLIRWHFWLAAVGIILMVGTLTVGGVIQGLALRDVEVSFMTSVYLEAPFRYVRSLTGIILTAAHVVFAVHFTLMLLRSGEQKKSATLFAKSTREMATV